MSREEARDELAHRWNAPTLMRAAAAEHMLVYLGLATAAEWSDMGPAWELLDTLNRRNNSGGKAA